MNVLLADFILYAHFAYVLFILAGLIVIYFGGWLRRPFVRNFAFRVAHLVAIAIVTFEALFGIVCPLTYLEDLLRDRREDEQTFMSRLVHDLLFYSPDEVPMWIFPVAYVAVLALTLGAWFRFPPRRSPAAAKSS